MSGDLVRSDGWMTVAAAAKLLDVSSEQVRDLVRDGVLFATKLEGGGMLLINQESVLRRRAAAPHAGRPLSGKNAWAMLWVVGDRKPHWVTSAERVRVHRYARRPLSQWPRLLSHRAKVRHARAPGFVVDRITRMSGVGVGGTAAALVHGAPLVSNDTSGRELYVTPAAFDELRGIPGIGWSSSSPNLILRVLPAELPGDVVTLLTEPGVVPLEVAAADLLDQADDRAGRVAAELLHRSSD
ncbi:helix-turn-helix domain-containing protein [Lentzea aerocolonigenes]|uniref:helix-turn-helix domain-containing protein n=1 Tax=Lentzea aerocolonigenes TaxID=68170 RepID=UPI000695F0B4|nr:helix-turn-helix domain-containing protein [Lentzea aerocolonigenes]